MTLTPEQRALIKARREAALALREAKRARGELPAFSVEEGGTRHTSGLGACLVKGSW